eukprot:7357265-Prymnesium_polylepis.1
MRECTIGNARWSDGTAVVPRRAAGRPATAEAEVGRVVGDALLARGLDSRPPLDGPPSVRVCGGGGAAAAAAGPLGALSSDGGVCLTTVCGCVAWVRDEF